MARVTESMLALLVIVSACSHPASSLDESSLEPVFDSIGDRVATDIQLAASRPMRSKLAVIEPLAWATPVGFPRYAHVLAEHHIEMVAFAAFANARPDAFERLGARVERRAAHAILPRSSGRIKSPELLKRAAS